MATIDQSENSCNQPPKFNTAPHMVQFENQFQTVTHVVQSDKQRLVQFLNALHNLDLSKPILDDVGVCATFVLKKLVQEAVQFYSVKGNGWFYLSLKYICKDTGYAKTTVHRALGTLTAKNYIKMQVEPRKIAHFKIVTVPDVAQFENQFQTVPDVVQPCTGSGTVLGHASLYIKQGILNTINKSMAANAASTPSNPNFRKQTESQNTQNSPYAAPPQGDGGRMSRRNLKAQKSPNDGSAVQGKFDCPIPDNGNYAPSSKNEIKNLPRPREAQDSPLAPPAPIAALIATLEGQPHMPRTATELPLEGTKLKNMSNRKGRGKKREKAQIQRPLENEHKYDFSEYTQDEIRFAKSWFIYASERWLTVRHKGWEGCCYDWLDGIKKVTRGLNPLCDFDRLVTLLEWAKTDDYYSSNIRDLSCLDKKWKHGYMLHCLSDDYDAKHKIKPRKTATANNETLNIPNEIPTLVRDVLAEAYDPDKEYFEQMCRFFAERLVSVWEVLDKCNAKQSPADKQDWIYGKICLQKLEAIPRLWNQYSKGEQPDYGLYSRWDRFWQKVDKWRDNEIARGKPGIWVMDKLYNYIGGTNGN